MDFKQLLAMVTVAEVGSVTRAARLLHIVQPAVTRHIRTLEDELGVALFERTRHGMELTPAGETLLVRARRILQELERAAAELKPALGQVAGIVTVGVLESLVDLIPQALATAVRDHHPGVELRILTGYSGYLQGWLDDGEVDMALLYNLADTPSVAVTPLLDEDLWAVAPVEASLRPEVPVSWQTLLSQPLVLPIAGHGLRTLIDTACLDEERRLKGTIETNSMLVQKQLVRGGQGWTVLPAVGVVEDVRSGRLSGGPLTDPAITRSVVLGLPRAARTPPAAEAVAAELVRLVVQLVKSGDWPSATLTGT